MAYISYPPQDRISTNMETSQQLYTIAVIGSFSSGKTSLINAMLGENVYKGFTVPTFDVVTVVKHGVKKEMILYFKHDLTQNLNTEIPEKLLSLIKKSSKAGSPSIRLENDEIEDFFFKRSGSIRLQNFLDKIELFYPNSFLKEGFEVVDMPGLCEHYSQNDTIKDYLRKANIILYIISIDHFYGFPLRDFDEYGLNEYDSDKIHFIISKCDKLGKQPEKLIRYVEDKLCPFTNNPIFFVSSVAGIIEPFCTDGSKKDSGMDDLLSYLKNVNHKI